jgi:misacylated tRNA(Ala) deacylase
MTEMLFRDDAYLKECAATVTSRGDDYLCLDRSVFYALGGGQPGDTGTMAWDGGAVDIIDTRYGDDGDIRHFVVAGAALPPVGTGVTARLDWRRRYIHMRMHTAMHLLGSILRYGVTGGNISVAKSRLDFDTHESIDKEAVTAKLLELVAADKPVGCRWITDAELEAQPELVRTMSVQPPKGAGRVRLLEIEGIDLQPCGGTHVRQTAEVGEVRVSKVENKGKHNRRVNIVLDQ